MSQQAGAKLESRVGGTTLSEDPLFTQRGFAFVLALVIAFECLQPTDLRPSTFHLSYWLVNYDFGFVRRGLGGEALQMLGGGTITPAVMLAAVWSTSLLPVAALTGLVMLLVRHGTTASIAVAALIACSPWTFEALWGYRRPDGYGLVALIGVALVLAMAKRRRQLFWLALIGLAMGGLVFLHEASVVVWGVGGLTMAALARESVRWRVFAAAALFWPASVAVLLVLAAGTAEPAVIDGLMGQAATNAFLAQVGDDGATVLPYLDDTLADSVRFVAGLPIQRKLLMVAWIVALLVIHVGWLRVSMVWLRRVDWLTVAAMAVMGVAAAFAFATGSDWQRWGCSYGTAALVIVAFQALMHPPGSRGTSVWNGQIPLWMIAVGVYLATRRPMAPDGDPSVLSYIRWWL